MIYIGIDDTDTLESRGTGNLARSLAGEISSRFPVLGVTRHQLFINPKIPFTAKNSCAALHIEAEETSLSSLFALSRAFLKEDFIPGSDPGLAVAAKIPEEVSIFGMRCKEEVVTRQEAYKLAEEHDILLEGLGGTFDGVIGALAAVGLAAAGNDGRFVMVRQIRELEGPIPVETIYKSGVDQILDDATGKKVTSGILTAHKLRPSLIDRQVVLFVAETEAGWYALRKD